MGTFSLRFFAMCFLYICFFFLQSSSLHFLSLDEKKKVLYTSLLKYLATLEGDLHAGDLYNLNEGPR